MIIKAAARATEQPQALRSVFGVRTAAHAPVFADSGSHGGLGMAGGGSVPRRTGRTALLSGIWHDRKWSQKALRSCQSQCTGPSTKLTSRMARALPA
jgi:hypothetical protein